MALGVTVLGWVPLGKRAAATAGTEYTNCTVYSYDGIICTPQVYSPSFCGTDKWFKNGCFRGADNYTDCYRPKAVCNGRNAWRWNHNGYTYRCADGEVQYYGSSTWYFKICNARL